MPRRAAGLTAAKVRTAKSGRYGDGGGLYLLIRRSEAKFWLFRYTRDKKMREMGLGAATGPAAVSLAEARIKAADLLKLTRAGVDPLAHREAEAKAAKAATLEAEARSKTFREVAERYLAAHEAGWHNAKHRQHWRNTLATYAFPHMGDVPVSDVRTTHVMAAIEPIWTTKPETAGRVRGRVEAVLDYAQSLDLRTGENPARWRGHVANMLPRQSKVRPVRHHAALPWREVGAFMTAVRSEGGLAARAMELAILTAARTAEVLGARWPEFDLDEAVWTVPAERMKAGKLHRVPLTAPAVAALRALLPLRDVESGEWVFPGARVGKPLSDMALLMLLRRMARSDITPHGFRSTFRDWSAENTDHQHEVAEAALAHTLGDKVEAAYRRGDMFEKRRALMTDWAAFCAERTAST